MKNTRGSEWNKWDLHIHTASSYDSPYKADDADELLCQALAENDIKAVAITDHFKIDKTRIEHLRKLAPEIVFFPGVELRTDKGANNLHLILIFSELSDLETLSADFNAIMLRTLAKSKESDETIYWQFDDIVEFCKNHGGLISIHAGKKSNGIDKEISNALPVKEAIKSDIAKHVDFFEVGKKKDIVDYYKYVMYDANNPKDAPYGYIARTNFSFAGKVNEGAGYVRYMEADQVLMKASATGNITPQFIFNDLSRSFRNRMLDIDLRSGGYNRPQASGWFIDQDFIPRSSTSCSVVVQGVKPGVKAELTTMWTLLGYPPTGIAVPLWVKDAGKLLPGMVRFNKEHEAALLSDWSLRLADRVFSYKQGMGTGRYLNWERLYSPGKGDGYMTVITEVEDEVFRTTKPLLEEWYKKGSLDSQAIPKLYDELESSIRMIYQSLLESE